MATAEGTTGQGRVTAFSVFGPVFGYASRMEDGRQVAYIGPLTPGVSWRQLWKFATECNVPAAGDVRKAEWIVTQASRAFICGSDVVVKLPDASWEMKPGGRRVDLPGPWANQDVLVTGNLAVPDLSDEQLAPKPSYYPRSAG